MQKTNEYQRACASLENYGVFASGTLGKSMWPLFREKRDIVIVRKFEVPPKKYDVVLYKRAEKCVLHRIIGRKGSVNLIRGDNTYAIEHIPDSEILGVLMEFDRGNKHYTVNDRGYKIYSVLWNLIYPIRYALFFLSRLPHKVFQKFFYKKRGKI